MKGRGPNRAEFSPFIEKNWKLDTAIVNWKKYKVAEGRFMLMSGMWDMY